jgi:hypothetical protein
VLNARPWSSSSSCCRADEDEDEDEDGEGGGGDGAVSREERVDLITMPSKMKK